MANILNLIFKADSKEVKEAGKDFDFLKSKVSDLSKEIPGLGNVVSSLGNEVGAARTALAGMAEGAAGLALGAAAAAVAVGALGIAMAFKFADKIDGFGDLGEKMGITADQAYYLSTAAQQAGGSLEAVMGMVNKLSKAMANSGVEMQGVGAAFVRLGVKTRDTNGHLKSNADVMDQLVEKWEKSAKTTSDYADMAQILGKNFEEQLAVYKSVKAAQDVANEAYEKGIGITKLSLEITSQQEKAQLKLGGVFNSMGAILVEQVLPAFNALINWFVRSYTEGGFVAKVFAGIVVVTELVMIGVKALTSTFMVLVETLSIVGDVGTTVFKGLWQVMKGDFEGAKNTLLGGFDNIKERIKGVAHDVGETWKGTWDNSAIRKLIESGGDVTALINRKGDLSKPNANPLAKGAAGGDVLKEDKPGEDPNKSILQLIDSLNKQAMAQENLNKVEQVGRILQDEKYKGASAENKLKVVQIAQLIDEATARKVVSESLKETTKITDDYVHRLRQEVAARNKSRYELMEEQEIYKLNQRTLEAIQKLKDRGIKGLDFIRQETELLNQNAEAQKRVKEATKERVEADNDWLTRGVDQYLNGLGTINDALMGVVDNGLKGMEDGLVNLFTTGKFGFKEFVRSILEQLVRMVVQFTIMIPIIESFKAALAGTGGATSGFGAIGTFIGSLFSAHGNAFTSHHAKGDVVSSPTNFAYSGGMGQMGDAGDEGVLPLRRNAAGDLGVISTGGGGKGITMVNNITINSSGDTSKPEDQARLGRTIVTMIDQRINELNMKANRAGGINNRVSMQIG